MFKKGRNIFLMNEAGAAGDAGGGGVTIDPKEFAALQESIRKLEEKNRELLAEKGEAKSAAQKAAEEAARKSGDIEALDASWKKKHEAALHEAESLKGTIGKMTAGQTAQKLAAEITIPGSADVLLPHIERRLQTELTADGAVVRVLDKNGKPSAMTVEELKKEIMADKAFAPLIIGSKASGAGGVGGKGSGGAKTVTRAEFNAMNPVQKMETAKKARSGEVELVD